MRYRERKGGSAVQRALRAVVRNRVCKGGSAVQSVRAVVRYTDQTCCVAHSLKFRYSCLCWTLHLDLEFVCSNLLTADCSQRCVCVCVCVLVHNTTDCTTDHLDCTVGTFHLPGL